MSASALAYALAVLVPIYVLAFYLGIPWFRAAAGGVLLLGLATYTSRLRGSDLSGAEEA
jgi:hypothetical protein